MKKTLCVCTMLVLVGGLGAVGQEKAPGTVKQPAHAAAKTASDPVAAPAANLNLTAEEGKDLDINQLKIQNLDLRIESMRTQIMNAKQQLSQETTDLIAKFAKAHNIDTAKYRLDFEKKVFVPVAAPFAPKAADPKK